MVIIKSVTMWLEEIRGHPRPWVSVQLTGLVCISFTLSTCFDALNFSFQGH